ncbi:SDR family oxidoreductase [Embleya scabrispora]|uniref:SDR family oxidoreductase n=1 Tax=Embleya scabrispora TaxID=159449 RepID=UPI00036B9678|nr:SDR family oxidoreductase [Embleya scabrispora]MYS79093.1 NAD-dependent epimerase/dehydratase family protein [Streptomyces sp. SID5474]
MRVAITGATGFLGLHLLRELLDRHRTITVLSHSGSRGTMDRIRAFLEVSAAPDELVRRLPERLRIVETDLTLPRLGLLRANFTSLADSVDVIWHCAGDRRVDATLADLRPVNVEGTRHLLELAEIGRRRPRLLHISTAYVAGSRREGTVKEELSDDADGFENDYERSRYEAELLVRDWAARLGRSAMIFRPTTLVSDRPGLPRNALRYMVERAEVTGGCAALGWAARLPQRVRPVVRVVSAPEGRLNFMPVHEAARVMTRLADVAGGGGVDVFHVRHPHDVPVEVVHEVLAEFLPVRLRFVTEPPIEPTGAERLAEAHLASTPYLTHRRGYDDSGVRALLGEPRSAVGIDRDYLVDCVRPGRSGLRTGGRPHARPEHGDAEQTGSVELGCVLRFRGLVPTVEDLREGVAARLWRVPMLAYRMEGGYRRRGPVDPARHVHVQQVGPDRLDVAVDAALADRLPRDRPLWETRLVHGHAHDEWAVIVKAHPSLLDGASLVEVSRRLFGVEPIDIAPAHPHAAGDPGARARVRRLIPPSTRPFATRGLTGTRHLGRLSLDAERLRTAEATPDELFLAALAGALRDCAGVPWRRRPRPVWALVPAPSADGDADLTEPGGHARPTRVRLPCNQADPARRLALVKEALRAAHPASGARWNLRAATSPWQVDLAAGPVHQWLRGPYAFRGSPMIGAIPFDGMPQGMPFGMFLAMFEDSLCVSAVVDTGLTAGLAESLCASWSTALDELTL